MSKAVLLSIKPQYCKLIASGKKTVEVRKTKPKIETSFKCYIYCTKGEKLWKLKDRVFLDGQYKRLIDKMPEYLLNGKIIGEFVCDFVDEYIYDYCTHPEIGMDYDCGDNWWEISEEDLENACLTEEEFRAYAFPKELMHGWHISDLVIYDKPKKLSEFHKHIKIFDGATIKELEELGILDARITRAPQSWCYVEELEC